MIPLCPVAQLRMYIFLSSCVILPLLIVLESTRLICCVNTGSYIATSHMADNRLCLALDLGLCFPNTLSYPILVYVFPWVDTLNSH